MPMNSFQRRRWSLKMSGITGIEHGQTVPDKRADAPKETNRAHGWESREDSSSNNGQDSANNLD